MHFINQDIFVPWDSYFKKALKDLEGEKIEDTVEGYIKVLKLYKKISERFSKEEIKEIEDLDFNSIKMNKTKNNFIRIIDKILWWHGKKL